MINGNGNNTNCYVGNDILSIKNEFNRRSFSNKRYLSKALTTSELLFVEKNRDSRFLPHLLWTCKESVYKIELKNGDNNNFVPRQYEVRIEVMSTLKSYELYTGIVKYNERVHFFYSQIFRDYILTTACNKEYYMPQIQNYIGMGTESKQSDHLRKHLKSKLSEYFNISVKHFEILKSSKGIPYVQSKFNLILPDISFSHDGSYYSYAYLMKNDLE